MQREYDHKSDPDILSVDGVREHLDTKLIGKKIIVLESIDSTNSYLKKAGFSGEESGTVVIAREQTSGKGRLGRKWKSNKDDSVIFSVILRPQLSLCEISAITLLSGLAVCVAVRDLCNIDCRIKWPNDIIVNNKKLSGMLTEMSTEPDGTVFTVTGIGINASQTAFESDIAHKATSLFMLTGKNIDKNRFLATILGYMEKYLTDNDCRLTEETVNEYTHLCATIGREVKFTRDNREVCGKAISVDRIGQLEVLMSDGRTEKVNSGEVTVQGIY